MLFNALISSFLLSLSDIFPIYLLFNFADFLKSIDTLIKKERGIILDINKNWHNNTNFLMYHQRRQQGKDRHSTPNTPTNLVLFPRFSQIITTDPNLKKE
jgi:hypothetical protein